MSHMSKLLEYFSEDMERLNLRATSIASVRGYKGISPSTVSRAKEKFLTGISKSQVKGVCRILDSDRLKKFAKKNAGKTTVDKRLKAAKISNPDAPVSNSFNERMQSLENMDMSDKGSLVAKRIAKSPIPISSSSKSFAAYETVFSSSEFSDDGVKLLREFIGSVNDKLGTEDLSLLEMVNPRSLEVRKNLGEK